MEEVVNDKAELTYLAWHTWRHLPTATHTHATYLGSNKTYNIHTKTREKNMAWRDSISHFCLCCAIDLSFSDMVVRTIAGRAWRHGSRQTVLYYGVRKSMTFQHAWLTAMLHAGLGWWDSMAW